MSNIELMPEDVWAHFVSLHIPYYNIDLSQEPREEIDEICCELKSITNPKIGKAMLIYAKTFGHEVAIKSVKEIFNT